MTKRLSTLPRALPRALPAALAGAMAIALAMPVAAAETVPGPTRTPAASIKLDFGAGRRVRIACGDTALQACLEAAKPVIDQVASTPVAKERMGRHHRKGWMRGAAFDPGTSDTATEADDAATAP